MISKYLSLRIHFKIRLLEQLPLPSLVTCSQSTPPPPRSYWEGVDCWEYALSGSGEKSLGQKLQGRSAGHIDSVRNRYWLEKRNEQQPGWRGFWFAYCQKWSGWRDLNPRPHAPQAYALPSCATARLFWKNLNLVKTQKSQKSSKLARRSQARQRFDAFWAFGSPSNGG